MQRWQWHWRFRLRHRLNYDIAPGDADESILVFRVETEHVGAMMLLIGRSTQHAPGAALLRAWVDAMPADDCQSE